MALCASLPLLPTDKIVDGWSYVQSEAEEFNDVKLNNFMKYMKTTWMKNNDYIYQWFVYNERHRTNNVTENWHAQINKKIHKNCDNRKIIKCIAR